MTDWTTPRSTPWGRSPRSARSRVLDRTSPLRRLDWVLQLAVLGLVGLGAVLVWSATRQNLIDAGGDPQSYLKKDVLNVVIGLLLGAVAALIDYRSLRAYAPVVYALAVLGLLVVLSPAGATINGAHSRIVIGGGFELQPAEFVKIAFVVGMAMILSEKRDRDERPRSVDVLLVLGLAGVPLVLILLQPDIGSLAVLVFITLGVIGVSGASLRWVIGLVLGGVLLGGGILHAHLLKPYQQARLTQFTKPNAKLGSTGYNVNEAKIAIGSGGLSGQGLFRGIQTNGHYVPEQQTDFIFTVAGEELGFAGSSALLLLLAVVLLRGMRIAANAEDAFGRLCAVGIVTWFAFQAFINIGMTMGIMPVTGIPLPFVSYGGSAMFANLTAVGLLQNVHMRSGSRDV